MVTNRSGKLFYFVVLLSEIQDVLNLTWPRTCLAPGTVSMYLKVTGRAFIFLCKVGCFACKIAWKSLWPMISSFPTPILCHQRFRKLHPPPRWIHNAFSTYTNVHWPINFVWKKRKPFLSLSWQVFVCLCHLLSISASIIIIIIIFSIFPELQEHRNLFFTDK